ncbi:MAG: YceI family protein [Bdellovibrionales bacterium]
MKSIFLACLIFGNLAFSAEASFDIKLSPAGNFTGKTSDVKGSAKKMGSKFTAENIMVNLTTVKTGIELRDEHTLKYLEASKHPNAILVKAEGENGKGTGVIKIKGIEKPIKGTFKINGNELMAEFPISLKEFKIEGIRYMGVGVKDQVIVKVKVPVQ